MRPVEDFSALDVLCPMHLILGPSGHILHAGPTLRKMRKGQGLTGKRFLEVFEVRRPRALHSMTDLVSKEPQKLRLKLRDAPHTALKGVLVPAVDSGGTMIVNLSFGISILDGVRDFALTNADFAATDLAIEMLYLIEAKTAAMEASYNLNSKLQGAKIAAEEQAYTDTLTGLKNRRALDTVLTRLLATSNSFAVMHIDLDYFKTVNDTLGHAAGDHVLQYVARIMVDETRSHDLVARVGGDEFTLVLPDVRDEGVLRRVGRRIIQRLEVPIPFEGTECKISASIGTVWIQPGDNPTMEDLLSDADVALYASKHAGRATQTLYTPDLRDAANAIGAPSVRTPRPA
ncbi:diguanylate cyclase [Sulfitobacter sp. M57]|uniref:diguanylate cyclase domain-containing protein n=1 Tax=unclassified Sulfitobacter TaxID=196795 RepID=UPI0023E0E77C|nr:MULTISPECIES: diguanylate cyclase [unclassified Sulfitobacter]MDF3414231.1 diguanylate cyclase [Sulfitobacter sp. KE5]MDF3420487.1 diguanylate cyclase [Sulfitobacter sp. KE43]MDF3432777.1 diguanylate cyclase [Sulfitobacter sp. KE42]MDF3458417.1 diguanylate cyclase [Sulfitobacter sp. S74]MDF3462317.1 diguanylate cyclase [Sulfitobacter sp. Ks18]